MAHVRVGRLRVADLREWLADKDDDAYVLLPYDDAILVAHRWDNYGDEPAGWNEYLEFDGGPFTDADK